jgi:hypothetical protein
LSGKNYYVHSNDEEELQRLKDDYEFMGRECIIEGSRLTVFSGKRPEPAKAKKAKRPERRPRREE